MEGHAEIIAQTGWGQIKDKTLASEAGFDHHLTKPVALAHLEKGPGRHRGVT